jgi:hypothetical protein
MSDLKKGLEYKVKLGKPKTFKVVSERTMPSNYFHELYDIDINNITRESNDVNQNQFVIMYDSSNNKFKLVDPDNVLVAAASTTGASANGTESGLPDQFVTSVEDSIDIDGGYF